MNVIAYILLLDSGAMERLVALVKAQQEERAAANATELGLGSENKSKGKSPALQHRSVVTSEAHQQVASLSFSTLSTRYTLCYVQKQC